MRRRFHLWPLLLLLPGCTTMWNPAPPGSERQSLDGIVRLTGGFAQSVGARFSHDGRWLLFNAALPDRPARIYLAQCRTGPDGAIQGLHRPIPVTPPQQSAGDGCFSPDGQSLYLACAPLPGSSGVWPVMNLYRADGWQGAVAALAPRGGINLARHPVVDNNAFNGEISPAPDGRWLVFTSNRDGDPELYAMAPDGSHLQRLTHHAGYDGWASLSPDGGQLLFQRQVAGQTRIMVANVIYDPQGRPTGLSDERSLGGGFSPCWHPDGRHILFAATAPNGDTELYVVRADGSRRTRLTFTPGGDLLPAVSPDGHWLIWTSARGEAAEPQLYLARFHLPEGS